MAYRNAVQLIGRAGKPAEMRYTPEGTAVANLSVATTRKFRNAAGEKQEETDWHRVVFFGRVAEVAGDYVRKGSLLFIEGRLRNRKWTDEKGTERTVTEIVGEDLQLLDRAHGSRDDRAEANAAARPSLATGDGATAQVTSLDDVAF